MKLVVAIVNNEIADDLLEALTSAEFRATRLASTGGFLRQGNTTIIVGVSDEQVERVIAIISKEAQPNQSGPTTPAPGSSLKTNGRTENATNAFDFLGSGAGTPVPSGKATVFVIDLERYERV